MPALRELHPAAEANVLRTVELLRDEAAVLDAAVDAVLAEAGDPPSLEHLRALPPALARLVVQRLARPAPPSATARTRSWRSPRGRRSTSAKACAPGSSRAACDFVPTPPRVRRLDCPRVLRDESIGEILVQADELQHRVRQMGEEITRDYEGKDLLLIGVLKGAVFFLSDLMRHIEVPCEVDFMAVASYGSSTQSSGVVRILKDLDAAIEGRDVLIVEDIVDSGLTLSYLLRNLQARQPASLEVCALLTKPERREVDLPTRYVGFEIPDKFAIGYGLDHAERYRNLPYVAALRLE